MNFCFSVCCVVRLKKQINKINYMEKSNCYFQTHIGFVNLIPNNQENFVLSFVRDCVGLFIEAEKHFPLTATYLMSSGF